MNKYLEKALEIAQTSKCRYRHGCVVVSKKGKVVAQATNKKVGDPETAWRRSHIHAEVAALVAAGTLARGAMVYVARVNKAGEPVLSKPCVKCERYLKRYGVAGVVWT